MIVAPGAYLIVIPDVCKNPSVPFRRHSGRPAKIRALPFAVIPDARSAIWNRSSRLGCRALNQVRVLSADAAYQQRPFELAEVLVGSGSFWPVLSMLRLPHLSSA